MRRTSGDTLSRFWRDLVERRLPAASRTRPAWPVFRDHCFARILLDEACGGPWRERVAPPAWANMPADRLRVALALGEAVLAGTVDLEILNRRSLARRRRAAQSRDGLDHAHRTVYRRGQSRAARQPSLFDRDLDDQR